MPGLLICYIGIRIATLLTCCCEDQIRSSFLCGGGETGGREPTEIVPVGDIEKYKGKGGRITAELSDFNT